MNLTVHEIPLIRQIWSNEPPKAVYIDLNGGYSYRRWDLSNNSTDVFDFEDSPSSFVALPIE